MHILDEKMCLEHIFLNNLIKLQFISYICT